MTDFEQLVAILSKAKVEFVIVGGLAATAHGSSRLTQDVDPIKRAVPLRQATWVANEFPELVNRRLDSKRLVVLTHTTSRTHPGYIRSVGGTLVRTNA